MSAAPVEDELAAARAERLARWEKRANPWIVVSAVLPLVTGLLGTDRHNPAVALDLVTWAVFFVDLVVHLWLRRGYLRTRQGWVDVVIVLLTFPWYLLPGLGRTQFLAVFRIARLARLLAVGKSSTLHRIYDRLGTVALWVGVVMVVCAAVVKYVEPAGEGFDTWGDAIWWALVTVTTVGYGDLVPTTAPGRFAGAVLMLLGLATLGTIGGVLAGVFGIEQLEGEAVEGAVEGVVEGEVEGVVEGEVDGVAEGAIEAGAGQGAAEAGTVAGRGTADGAVAGAALPAELELLRAEVAALRALLLERLPSTGTDQGGPTSSA